jgi:exodeoxyribonuclease VII small subunit
VDFEKKLARLEEIVGKLEDGELPLEESLKLFEEGVGISRECNKQLSEAEKKVKVLMSTNPETTKDFEVTAN